MCSEKNPFDCHRANMVAEYFYQNNFEIIHIIDKQTFINHDKFDGYYNDNFKNKKSAFIKSNRELLDYASNLFEKRSNELPDYIKKWLSFFDKYDRSKGWKLRNIEIGYKEGNIEND